LDLKSGELRGAGRTVILPEKPFRILLILMEKDGELVDRDAVQKRLWPNDTVVDFEHGINSAMKRLRQALGDSAENPKYIETIPRRGYRLLVPVERVAAGAGGFSAADGTSLAPIPIPNEPGPPANGSSVPAPSAESGELKLIGKKVSHYRVLEVIGGGGMGLVYRAEDLKLGRQVALKFLPEELARDAVALRRFEREAQTASSLDHLNICTIHEVEEHDGHPFIVMQLLRGETLRDRLARLSAEKTTLRVDELLDIAVQIASGLEAAHAKGIIHRDVKPANTFLPDSGPVKILDFGLAKAMSTAQEEGGQEAQCETGRGTAAAAQPARVTSPDATLTRLGVAIGTAGHMSPEQIRGENLDARSDIFSFGLVLYEMATGQRAFSRETEADLHEAIVNDSPVPIREVNPKIPDALAQTIERCLEKERERRYQSANELRSDLETARGARQAIPGKGRSRRAWTWVTAIALSTVVATVGLLYWRHRHAFRLTPEDTIVIAEFANLTSDPAFNDIFKPALEVEFGQTPFLNSLSPEKVAQTLTLMKKPVTERVTPAIAGEVCRHTNSSAYISGSINDVGNRYRLELSATDCKTGTTFAHASADAAERNQVVSAMGTLGTSLRRQLGEPRDSLERYNKPLAEATTASLEALRAYAKGVALQARPEGIPYLKQAVELDPEYAGAYDWLYLTYNQLRLTDLAYQSAQKAYELRFRRLAFRDQLIVEILYLQANGQYEAQISKAEQMLQEFPRSPRARNMLGVGYLLLGHYEKVGAAGEEVLRLMPESRAPYGVLATAYLALDRLDEATNILDRAGPRKVDIWVFHWIRYRIGFLQNNQELMGEQLRWAEQNPASADFILNEAAEAEAYYGHLRKADALTEKAVEAAVRAGAPQRAAQWTSIAALRAARMGDMNRAQTLAREAMTLKPIVWSAPVLAQAFAETGDIAAALELKRQVEEKLPQHVTFQRSDLPALEAEIYLQQGKPDAAIRVLETTAQYDLKEAWYFGVDPAYVRGEAYLKAGRADQAATQFHKVIDHPGLVANSINGPLSRLQLARAQVLMGDKQAARSSYQEFLKLWKDADPDLPIFKQAKSEYAKLQ
jgi:serine/threonine protein kinase/DNA-binding winged helix-turn-helix (wHTH) protein/tetratricopeptide (TPR) repeat protein